MKQHTYTLGNIADLGRLSVGEAKIETSDTVSENSVRRYSDGTVSAGPQYLELPETPDPMESIRQYRRQEQIKQLIRMRQRVLDWANNNRIYPRSRRVFWMMKIHYILMLYGIRLDLSADLESAAYGTRESDKK